MKKILVTGGSGRLGRELIPILEKRNFEVWAPTHEEFDILGTREQLLFWLAAEQPQLVIHAAAMTGIPNCDKWRLKAWRTNVEGTHTLRQAADAVNATFVYISTPCVFDCVSPPFDEGVIPYPANFYGLTKLVGEVEAIKANHWLVLRGNFVPRGPWPYPKAFSDRYGTYLFADQFANAITDVVQSSLYNSDPMNLTIHLVGDRKISMLELARMTTPDIEEMTLDEYDGPTLSKDMTMITRNWTKTYSIDD